METSENVINLVYIFNPAFFAAAAAGVCWFVGNRATFFDAVKWKMSALCSG